VIAFIQTYGLNGPAGGPKLMRGLLQAEHPPVLSIYTGIDPAPLYHGVEEIHLPKRPDFGRIDHSRFHAKFGMFDRFFESRFERKLRRILLEHHVKLIHIIPHGYDIVPVRRLASELNIPCFVTVHDDIEMMSRNHPFLKNIVAAVGEAWRDAKGAFVISDEIGREYSNRYGAREYEIVTDGLASMATAPQPWAGQSLRVYFMGLFLGHYKATFRAMLDALQIVRKKRADLDISVTSRSGYILCPLHPGDVPVNVNQFSSDVSEAEKSMLSFDLLYLPMPFGDEQANFRRFSMSTKMVTYLGSGLPIFYHGPEDAAVCELLKRHNAAVICTSLDPGRIAEQLMGALPGREAVVGNALALARSRFMLADQQQKFWNPIVAAL
jgi:hypothetical protein